MYKKVLMFRFGAPYYLRGFMRKNKIRTFRIILYKNKYITLQQKERSTDLFFFWYYVHFILVL